jgi:hypothetical protein
MEHRVTQSNKESQLTAQIIAVAALVVVLLIISAYFKHWY